MVRRGNKKCIYKKLFPTNNIIYKQSNRKASTILINPYAKSKKVFMNETLVNIESNEQSNVLILFSKDWEWAKFRPKLTKNGNNMFFLYFVPVCQKSMLVSLRKKIKELSPSMEITEIIFIQRKHNF